MSRDTRCARYWSATTQPPLSRPGEYIAYFDGANLLESKNGGAYAPVGGGAGDVLVKATGADTTANFLSPKLAAGANVTLTVLNPGGDEQVEIAAAGGADELVKVSNQDTTPDFLGDKVVAGANVTLTVLNPGANEQIEIAAAGGGGGGGWQDDGVVVRLVTTTDDVNIGGTTMSGSGEKLRIEGDFALLAEGDTVLGLAGGTNQHAVNIAANNPQPYMIQAPGGADYFKIVTTTAQEDIEMGTGVTNPGFNWYGTGNWLLQEDAINQFFMGPVQRPSAGDNGRGAQWSGGQGADGAGATPGAFGGIGLLTGGFGGAGTNTQPAGAGGATRVKGGNAGVNNNGGGAAGGRVDVEGGGGSDGAGATDGAAGGVVAIDGGQGGDGVAGQADGAGGSANLSGGNSGTGGDAGAAGGLASVIGGDGTTFGGDTQVNGGAGPAGNGRCLIGNLQARAIQIGNTGAAGPQTIHNFLGATPDAEAWKVEGPAGARYLNVKTTAPAALEGGDPGGSVRFNWYGTGNWLLQADAINQFFMGPVQRPNAGDNGRNANWSAGGGADGAGATPGANGGTGVFSGAFGGAGTGTAAAGPGGFANVLGGNAGTNNGGGAANGGRVQAIAGDGSDGSGATDAGDGGLALVEGGEGGNGVAGQADGQGGNAQLEGGNSGTGGDNGAPGGNAVVIGGTGTTFGGDAQMNGGAGPSPAANGRVQIGHLLAREIQIGSNIGGTSLIRVGDPNMNGAIWTDTRSGFDTELRLAGQPIVKVDGAASGFELFDGVGASVYKGQRLGGSVQHSWFGAAVAPQQTIVGSRGGNAALADLLTKLALYGLIIDGTGP